VTPGGPGIVHDDVTYPETLQSGGEAPFVATAGTRYDDVTYPTPSPRIAASLAPEATAHAALASGMDE
jgi:hypothetical protein